GGRDVRQTGGARRRRPLHALLHGRTAGALGRGREGPPPPGPAAREAAGLHALADPEGPGLRPGARHGALRGVWIGPFGWDRPSGGRTRCAGGTLRVGPASPVGSLP